MNKIDIFLAGFLVGWGSGLWYAQHYIKYLLKKKGLL